GVELLPEARRPFQVAEDDGNGLPDLLGHILGCELRPAESAQPESVGILLAAVGADLHPTSLRPPLGPVLACDLGGKVRGAPTGAPRRWKSRTRFSGPLGLCPAP